MNLHVADNNTDYPRDNSNHDPLHKVRAFIQMCERTFQLVYRLGCDLSYDETCCPRESVVLHLKCQQTSYVPSETVPDMRQKVVTYVHLIFTRERTRQDVHKLHKLWI